MLGGGFGIDRPSEEVRCCLEGRDRVTPLSIALSPARFASLAGRDAASSALVPYSSGRRRTATPVRQSIARAGAYCAAISVLINS